VEALVPELSRASGTVERVKVRLALEEVELVPERAIPCGMLVSELVTNALKHAFPGERRGSLLVRLERVRPTRLQLVVEDDGIGLASGFPDESSQSLGLDLVAIFAKQLEAELVVQKERGTRFQLTFEEGTP
jgi:two-component sensor histidine kinase